MGWFTDLLGSFSRTFTLGKGSAGPGVFDAVGLTASRTYTLQDASGILRLYGPVITSTATGSQNDFNPTGLAAATVLRLDPASALTITGLETIGAAQELIVINVSAQVVTLADEDVASSATKRLALGGVDITLAQHQPLPMFYDTTSSRWRAAASPGTTIDALTELTAVSPADDYVLAWDSSAGQTVKVRVQNVAALPMIEAIRMNGIL